MRPTGLLQVVLSDVTGVYRLTKIKKFRPKWKHDGIQNITGYIVMSASYPGAFFVKRILYLICVVYIDQYQSLQARGAWY